MKLFPILAILFATLITADKTFEEFKIFSKNVENGEFS